MKLKKSSVKLIFISLFIYLFIRIISFSLRWKLNDSENVLDSFSDSQPIIVGMWHNTILSMIGLYTKFFKKPKLVALLSKSKDGEIGAKVFSFLGVKSIRGSSSKGGASAILKMKSMIEKGYNVAIVPDGPRGPVYEASLGIFKLAQLSGKKILPISVIYNSYWEFNSWDKFKVPKPFSIVKINLNPFIYVPRDSTSKKLEDFRLEFKNSMTNNL